MQEFRQFLRKILIKLLVHKRQYKVVPPKNLVKTKQKWTSYIRTGSGVVRKRK